MAMELELLQIILADCFDSVEESRNVTFIARVGSDKVPYGYIAEAEADMKYKIVQLVDGVVFINSGDVRHPKQHDNILQWWIEFIVKETPQ